MASEAGYSNPTLHSDQEAYQPCSYYSPCKKFASGDSHQNVESVADKAEDKGEKDMDDTDFQQYNGVMSPNDL